MDNHDIEQNLAFSTSQENGNTIKKTTNGRARKLNKDLITSLICAFLKNPEVDLLSLVPTSYRTEMMDRKIKKSTKARRSKAAQLNRKTMDSLLSTLYTDPGCSLLSQFGPLYANDLDTALLKESSAVVEELDGETQAFHYTVTAQKRKSCKIAYPLSPTLETLLDDVKAVNALPNQVSAIQALIRNSDCLWKDGMGSFVAKVTDTIVVKGTFRTEINQCLILEYLGNHDPSIPIPMIHGLVLFGQFNLLFTSYIQGTTLTAAWPKLQEQDKLSIQTQLNDIFLKVRNLPRGERPLGLLSDNRVVDQRGHWMEYRTEKGIQTCPEFEDFVFSPAPYITSTYTNFLRGFLPKHTSPSIQDGVLTHCDARPDNIMVDVNDTGVWAVSGIIDWEYAGFYPPYWESVTSTRTLCANVEHDWYSYQPACIAPASFPVEWLVDITWDTLRDKVGRV